ncbi:E3 ubiquitin/ISG15 ligase TRIM25-like [Hoplias malabaricus]|uniref:E3 ubiquitin/ISG15 ligase TRIM25-like n=1 Tax=Hoplias malabaricus TaxID=27720 RepID=UPI003462582C
MSQPAEVLEQELSCPICLHLFSDPVSLPCGHSYCFSCVRSSQSLDEPQGNPRCPECRKEYDRLNGLRRNFKLSGIVEGYRMAMGSGRFTTQVVMCDQCLDGSEPAVKTCLHCETSLCQAHLKRHQERHKSRGHSLVDPTPDQDQKRCPDHLRDLEFLCLQDCTFLCNECVIEGKHNDHEVQTFEAASCDLRRVLEGHEKAMSQRLQMTETLLLRAQQSGRNAQTNSEKLSAKASALLDNMMAQISTYKERMLLMVKDEQLESEKMWQASVDVLKEYHQQLSNTKSSARELLSSSPSNFLFLQLYLGLEPRLRQAASVTIPTLPAPQTTDTKWLRTALSTDTFRTELAQQLHSLQSFMNPLELTFNGATLHHSLMMSTDMQTVKHWGGAKLSISSSDSSERFSTAVQVLCSQGFSSGTHLWTVELGPTCMWSVGLCYGSIPRKGDNSRLGHSALSWRLQWKNKKLTACHDAVSCTLAEGNVIPPKRLEVALDYEGGTLAFYSITAKGKNLHLHTFKTVFREMVFPAFALHSTTTESWITLVNSDVHANLANGAEKPLI